MYTMSVATLTDSCSPTQLMFVYKVINRNLFSWNVDLTDLVRRCESIRNIFHYFTFVVMT